MACSGAILVASDLDHTMVQNEDPTHRHLLRFNHAWQCHCKQAGGLLVYSTGRSPELFKRLWAEAPLITPDVLICSVGTEVFYNTARVPAALLRDGSPLGSAAPPPAPAPHTAAHGAAVFQPDYSWEEALDAGWDRRRALALVAQHFPQLTQQAASEQRAHKLSFTLEPSDVPGGAAGTAEMMARLQRLLKDSGISAKVIYSGGRDVDVISEAAGKGRALAFLLQRLQAAGCGPHRVQVAGDSGNDIELFEVPGVVGCVVANAHPELRAYSEAQAGAKHIHQATEPCAAGILQAMAHHGLLTLPPPVPPSTACGSTAAAAEALRATPQGAGPEGLAAQQAALCSEAGARAFGWRLGAGLVYALGEGIERPEDLLGHSAMRLLVANGCRLVLHPPGDTTAPRTLTAACTGAGSGGGGGRVEGAEAGSGAAGPGAVTCSGAAKSAAEAEVARGLQPEAVAAAHTCEPGGAWVDELEAVQVPGTPSAAGLSQGVGLDAAASSGAIVGGGSGASDAHVAAWRLRFTVYCLDAAGMRGEAAYQVEALAHHQAQPVPHGFLAAAVDAWPCAAAQLVPRIHARAAA